VCGLDLTNLAPKRSSGACCVCVGSYESIGLHKKGTSVDQLYKLQLVKGPGVA
jgi:hypothetical protein